MCTFAAQEILSDRRIGVTVRKICESEKLGIGEWWDRLKEERVREMQLKCSDMIDSEICNLGKK